MLIVTHFYYRHHKRKHFFIQWWRLTKLQDNCCLWLSRCWGDRLWCTSKDFHVCFSLPASCFPR